MATLSNQPQSNPLKAALRHCRFGFVSVVLFSFVINLLMLSAPLYMLQLFDRVLTSRSIETLFYLSLIAIFAFIILWGLEVVRGYVMVSLGTWLDQRIAGDVLAAALRTGLGKRNPSIQPVQDVGVLRNFMSGPAIFPILDAPWAPVFLAVVFIVHPILGWIAIAGAALLFLLAVLNEFTTRAPLVQAGITRAYALNEAQAAAHNVGVIEAMGMMRNFIGRWTGTVEGSLAKQAWASRIGVMITTSSKISRQLLQILLLGTGASLVLSNELSAGGMVASSILVGRALAPVEQAISSWRSAIGAGAAYRRINELLTIAPQLDITTHPLPKPIGNLMLQGVSFAYPGAKDPFLRNIDFVLQPGESLGLIGPTASGKSTLARLIVGTLQPQHGYVRFDGVDIARWHTEDRGQYVGYLPQDVALFSGTVQENISRFSQGNPESVYAAAILAGVHDDILALPDGYETEIGTGGMALSGGQRQRIGLARTVYGMPKLIVLDEPNANLDRSGEQALLLALSHLRRQGCTVIIVAHHPRILRNIDKILVLQRGVIEMFGPRDKLLAKLPDAEPQLPSQQDEVKKKSTYSAT